MKNISFILLLVLLTSCSQPKEQEKVYLFSYFVGNGADGLHLAYSSDGLKWEALNQGKPILTPEVGKDKLMRDPCIIQGPEGKFHMVWTSGWWDQYIGYANSSDLIHWSEQMKIPVMEHEPDAKNSWAPEIFYDDQEQRFQIFWASTIPGRHSDVAESEREKGLNHRIYATVTKDFENFEPSYLFFNPDFSVIDATILKHNHEYLLFLKNENPNPPEKNIRITTSKNAAGPYPTNVSEPITGNYWAEGPTTLQVGKYTYVYFDKYREHKYGAIRSANLKDWEEVSDSIRFPSGTRHGTAFAVDKEFFEQLNVQLSEIKN